MSNADHYRDLLDEYGRAYELVKRRLPGVEPAHQVAISHAVQQVRQNIQKALDSPPDSVPPENAVESVIAATGKFDEVLRQVLLDKQMTEVWEQHVNSVKAIILRPPPDNPTESPPP